MTLRGRGKGPFEGLVASGFVAAAAHDLSNPNPNPNPNPEGTWLLGLGGTIGGTTLQVKRLGFPT